MISSAPPAASRPPAAVAREVCRNCRAPRVGTYCHACGQPFFAGRLTVQALLIDLVTRVLSLEAGLLRTFWELSVRPGRMIREYVGGRRQRYTNPVAYLLISTAVSSLVFPLYRSAYVESLRADAWVEDAAGTEALVQVMLAMEKHPAAATLVFCLFFVFPFRLLFLKEITTAESFAFACFVFGHVTIWQSLFTPVAVVAAGTSPGRSRT